MASNLHIDQKLLSEAQRLGKFKTKREAVNTALHEFVRAQKLKGLIEMFGTIEYDTDYDYKAQRKRK